MNYTIQEHKHRFAAWAAGRGASTSPVCRFEVVLGKILLEESGLQKIGESINNIPSPNNFDKQHKIWRDDIIARANEHGKVFTHGIAAKLINLYLKSIFVCGEDIHDDRVKSIHPPIDSVLLNTLYGQDIGGQKDAWKKAKKTGWSKLNSCEYECVIKAVKLSTPKGHGLWEIEKHWQGYRQKTISKDRATNQK